MFMYKFRGGMNRPSFTAEKSFVSYDDNMTNMQAPMMQEGCCQMMPPVYECPQERVCHREFCYKVPHIIPINTKIINHHVYKHSYTPCYTECEENVCTNEYECGCQNF